MIMSLLIAPDSQMYKTKPATTKGLTKPVNQHMPTPLSPQNSDIHAKQSLKVVCIYGKINLFLSSN